MLLYTNRQISGAIVHRANGHVSITSPALGITALIPQRKRSNLVTFFLAAYSR